MSISGEDQTPVIGDTNLRSYIDKVFKHNANATTPQSSLPAPIPRVQEMARKKDEYYQKYYVPKVVSIGPYHHGKPKLESVQNLKPDFTMKLLGGNTQTLMSLYGKLGEPEMVYHLRSFYEENSTTMFSDMDFTNMMLLDACFILYCIKFIFGGKSGDTRGGTRGGSRGSVDPPVTGTF
ncbi:hypothetical protein HanPI659440_Chr13g0500131 [Helianthus annuus]|nr:hypothetical protein HanPI659440_Chr13g0500131 [Helianthus annuus]